MKALEFITGHMVYKLVYNLTDDNMIFCAENRFLKKRQLIALNSFSDFLGHSGLKNVGLPPRNRIGMFSELSERSATTIEK